MNRGRGGFNPFFNRGGGGFQKKTERPLFTMQNSAAMDTDKNDENLTPKADGTGTTYLTDREPGEYAGWKLYFPRQCELSFKNKNPDNNFSFSF